MRAFYRHQMTPESSVSIWEDTPNAVTLKTLDLFHDGHCRGEVSYRVVSRDTFLGFNSSLSGLLGCRFRTQDAHDGDAKTDNCGKDSKHPHDIGPFGRPLENRVHSISLNVRAYHYPGALAAFARRNGTPVSCSGGDGNVYLMA